MNTPREALVNLELQQGLCRKVYGSMSQWYYDVLLDKILVGGLLKEHEQVRSSYKKLMSIGDQAKVFFEQYKSLKVLSLLAKAFEEAKDLELAKHFTLE